MTHERRHFPTERDIHPPRQFRELFCERFHCPISNYRERAFRKLLYCHARPLAGIFRLLMPHFFLEDFKFIEALGSAGNPRKASMDAASFQDANALERGALRTALRLRVSGRKAMRLAHELFAASMDMTDAHDAPKPSSDTSRNLSPEPRPTTRANEHR
jgi:hypothetical protein